MRFFYLIIGLVFSTLCGFGQVTKIYIDAKGDLGVDRHKAAGYILIRKNSDSDYTVQKYNMRDTIIMRGNFKDSLMNVPNGKFVFYKKRAIPAAFAGTARADTNNFISQVGYYKNGKKTGMWVEFFNRTNKRCSYVYKNNELNGIYQRYHKYIKDYVLEEGEYDEGKKEGDWNFYGYDTLKTSLVTQVYKNGRLVKEVDHVKLAAITGDPNKYLRKALQIPNAIKEWLVITNLTINASGSVTDVKVIKSTLPSDINNKITVSLLSPVKFTPEYRDGNAKEGVYTFGFSKAENKYTIGDSYGTFLIKEAGNGMSIENRDGKVEEYDLWPDDKEARDY